MNFRNFVTLVLLCLTNTIFALSSLQNVEFALGSPHGHAIGAPPTLNLTLKTDETFEAYARRIQDGLTRLRVPQRYTIGGGDIQNIAQITQNPQILLDYLKSGAPMAAHLPQYSGRASQPRGDIGTATAYFLYVANALQGGGNDGNPAVTWDATTKSWSSAGITVSQTALLDSWGALLDVLFKTQTTETTSIIENPLTFKPETVRPLQMLPASTQTPVRSWSLQGIQPNYWKVFGEQFIAEKDGVLSLMSLHDGRIQTLDLHLSFPEEEREGVRTSQKGNVQDFVMML